MIHWLAYIQKAAVHMNESLYKHVLVGHLCAGKDGISGNAVLEDALGQPLEIESDISETNLVDQVKDCPFALTA